MKKQKLVFVLTSGRCGTVFISEALKQCPEISIFHERQARLLRLLQNAAGNEPRGGFVGAIGANIVRRNLRDAPLQRIHFEVNLPIRSFVGAVAADFPNALFVHVIRDPREFVCSSVNLAEQRSVSRWFKLHVPFWVAKPPKLNTGKGVQDRIFEIAVWSWYVSNRSYSALEESPASYVCFYFEELQKDPVFFLNRLLDISGYPNNKGRDSLPTLVDTANKNASLGSFSSWPDWPDKYIQTLDKICGPLMERYGYGQEKEWRERLAK